MTPTLFGRWQTRLLLYVFFGLPMTFWFAFYWNNWSLPVFDQGSRGFSVYRDPLVFITTILVLGLILDILYIQIQRFRWEQDWPFAFQFVVSILEFLAVFGLMDLGLMDDLLPDGRIPFLNAVIHFSLVFIPSFIALLATVQIFLIRWRYKGGELGRLPAAH